eukprot:Plantae.Rhodophyta-Purpureofilum_apyrenoidigerum.ctg23912.p1 GENE.Plantae.Rhodophyta-Purpureofilum_apyrenoidigerum.ctg23912~~Plantae.Rhodophyta-Purpureofilum_apyrenoidigerum.ctg23912.p1  ORF type:complete len:198 (+),score=40.86 Plantae.Rhodophyta-Purpureofilum_apyrenoidigerum.ctg23912:89-682(+)
MVENGRYTMVKESVEKVPEYVRDEVATVLLDERRIAERVEELGKQIGADFDGKNPLLLGILTGSFMFTSDLCRAVKCRHEVAFAKASSYIGQESSGVVKLVGLENLDVKGRHVIIVEDIVDTGRTVEKIVATLQEREAASCTVCTLLLKNTDRRSKDLSLPIKYVAFEIPDVFVIGYGLDFNQRLRHLPFVGTYRTT